MALGETAQTADADPALELTLEYNAANGATEPLLPNIGRSNESVLLPRWMWYMPMLYLGAWAVWAVIGPAFFTDVWLRFYVCYHVTLLVASIPGQLGTYHYIYRYLRPDPTPLVASTPSALSYAFIIPAYREKAAVLRDTMDILATHRAAKTKYIIVLAMEGREEGVSEKAGRLCDEFRDRFADITFSLHHIQPGEAAGKGSNVTSAAVHLSSLLRNRLALDPAHVMVTSMDADTLISQAYVQAMDHRARTYPRERLVHSMFMPVMTFYRIEGLPIFNQILDQFWAGVGATSIHRPIPMVIPTACYTISLELAERVGYWEVGRVGIGEDAHMATKCWLLTDGALRCETVTQPFAVQHINADGAWDAFWARFTQGRRHALGHMTILYGLWKLRTVSLRTSFWAFAGWLEVLMYGPFLMNTVVGMPLAALFGGDTSAVRSIVDVPYILQNPECCHPVLKVMRLYSFSIIPLVTITLMHLCFRDTKVEHFPNAVLKEAPEDQYENLRFREKVWRRLEQVALFPLKLALFGPSQIMYWSPAFFAYWELATKSRSVYVVAEKLDPGELFRQRSKNKGAARYGHSPFLEKV
jgi:hypothetical protein